MLLESKLPIGYIFLKVWKEFLLVTAFSAMTYIVSLYVEIPDIPISIAAFLGTAISLILAFKLAQSYDRWWEARIIWGAIVNDSRSLIVQAINFSNGADQQTVRRMANRQIAWCYSLGESLRKLNPLKDLPGRVSPEEIATVGNQDNVPLALINRQSTDIAMLHGNGTINDFQQVQMDETMVRLCASMGKAERIKNTVFPPTYRLHLHGAIYVFLGFLSVSIAEEEGLLQVLVMFLVAMPFLFLEKTAYYLQDPFENRPTDTAMTRIAESIEVNLLQLTEAEEVPTLDELKGYYVM